MPSASPIPGSVLRVKDCPDNTGNTFWNRYIGGTAHLVTVSSDGLWNVLVEDPKLINPVEGVRGERFDVISGPPVEARRPIKPWWKRWLERMAQ